MSIIKGGVAEQSGVLKIGDHILSINGQSVHNKPLSQAISLLQMTTNHITLTILRKTTSKWNDKLNYNTSIEINNSFYVNI